MILKFHKNFDKKYSRLNVKLKIKVDAAIHTFQNNPFDQALRNHPLKGNLGGKRSLYVAGDMRIIFEEIDDYVIVHLLDVGTHNQVY